MTKKFYPVTLFFEADVEYSKDNGANWLPLAANTELEISPLDLPANGRVKVRSSNAITTLDKDKLKFNSREFESINIKNGKSLTSLNTTFRGSFINNLRIANIPNCTNMDSMCYKSYINNIKISEATGVTNLESAFRDAFIRAHNGIYAPSATNTRYMMQSIKNNNIMGDIELGSHGVQIDASNTFYGADISLFPNVKINGAMHTGDGNGNGIFQSLKSKYTLHIKLGSLTNRDRFNNLLRNSSLIFSGLELYINDSSSYVFDAQNLEYPFSKLVKSDSSLDENITWSTLSRSHISQEIIDLIDTHNRPVIVELPDWIPNVISLEQYLPNLTVIDSTSFGAIGMNYRMIKDNMLYISKYISTIDDIKWEKPIANPYANNTVNFAKNGYYGYQDGADYKIYDSLDVIVQTLAGITPKAVQFNSDASKVIVTTGGSIDSQNTADQNVTNTVTVYNTADGSTDRVFNPATIANEEIIGAYFPSDDSNIQIVRTNWGKEEAFHNYLTALTSTIDSHNPVTNDMIENVSMIGSGNKVVNSYGEDNEFGILDTKTGKLTRCFGK